MPKKVLQDINTRNSDIKEDGFKRKWDYSQGGEDSGIVEREQSDSMNHASETLHDRNKGGGGGNGRNGRKGFLGFSRSVWFGITTLIVIISCLIFWSMSATATVRVVLSQQTTTINDNFSTVRRTNSEGILTYQIVKLQEKATRDVQPTSEENVERKASGQIIIYNKHSEASLKLIANTRFEAPDGKIYRIDKAITVPGAKGSGDDMVPGSIEVTVYADEAGAEYNIGLVDFTIPGLKTTALLYNDFFARSKTEISGGYSGVLMSASEEDIENTSLALQQKLRESLLKEIRFTIGDDSILYDEAIFIDFTTHVATEVSENGMLNVEEVGLLQAIIFERKELSSEIAKKSLSSYDNSIVLVRNLDEIHFVFENRE
ncbi:MAG: hypothetical protein KAI72_02945, partial [Candidatus Pacebacteria bacterium]|nr:hypothetical protein [Candidatus Paceibacterota bacterium]